MMEKWHCRKWSVTSPSIDTGATTQLINWQTAMEIGIDSFAAAFDEGSRAVRIGGVATLVARFGVRPNRWNYLDAFHEN